MLNRKRNKNGFRRVFLRHFRICFRQSIAIPTRKTSRNFRENHRERREENAAKKFYPPSESRIKKEKKKTAKNIETRVHTSTYILKQRHSSLNVYTDSPNRWKRWMTIEVSQTLLSDRFEKAEIEREREKKVRGVIVRWQKRQKLP